MNFMHTNDPLPYSRPAQVVPETDMYLANLHARLVSGHNSVSDLLEHDGDNPQPWRDVWRDIATSPVAVDIETAGLGADAFDMRCVTAAWWTPTDDGGRMVTGVLLDPRDTHQASFIRRIMTNAQSLVFHNATYDIPPLYQHNLITLDQIHKIVDTLVMARMAYPLRETDKSLEALATRDDLAGLIQGGGSMALAFKARGYARAEQGWAGMDIDQLPYRLGAMTDTVATLRLMMPIYDKCVHWLTSSPFEGATVPRTPADAHYLIDREQTVNRAMLRRSAIGLRVDRDYLHTYTEQTQQERAESALLITNTLGEASVGNGAHVVEYLDKQGLLPPTYPRTPTGKLKADKKAFASLPDHPLIQAHRAVADTDHILDYLSKVDAMATITGRVHPQVGVLGASATGRMSYRIPEFQQFPAAARPIVVEDTDGAGMVSVDLSSIEPVIMANCAGDHEFLHGFNTDPNTDLYDPIVKGEGIERKLAKKVMLATMYGQGVRRLAAELGISEDEARHTKNRVFAPMPATTAFMDNIQRTGNDHGVIMTADGRMQAIPKDPSGKYMGYKAVNYFCQGSAYSVLSESIASLYKAGMSDHIYLAIHDELVTTREAAQVIQEAMLTPPAWLIAFAGTTPVLRSALEDMGSHWEYCD
ncbi:putative DNA polymerase I [Corynebacterium phage phi673]|uniref:DNA polymerase n=1 Tax=Corynebacterium phage phi673 TaxID=2052821 RepID=A0A2H4PIV7_9CAUD|nr:putative DNA polymerase I [Corynebacterium phage phi673]ATW62908.1 putative DNA polymerase I [Corynebacterium phage phi673]